MPLEIIPRIVREEDLKNIRFEPQSRPLWDYEVPYALVRQHGYGRMDPSTPCQGLGAFGVAADVVVVMHCAAIGRTTVSDSPNFLYLNTFISMVDWVTGGPDQPRYSPCPYPLEALKFQVAMELPKPQPSIIDVVVLRGFAYGKADYGHKNWMQDFRNFFDGLSARRITANIVDAPRVLKFGAVVVDKETGTIHPIEAPAKLRPLPTMIELTQTVDVLTTFSLGQKYQSEFASSLLMAHLPPEPAPIEMQFNIRAHVLPVPLTDEARQLLRSARASEPESSQSAIIKKFKNTDDWIARAGEKLEWLASKMVFAIAVDNCPCERCGSKGSHVCQRCRGAWYCK
jgi:hypothetical protein